MSAMKLMPSCFHRTVQAVHLPTGVGKHASLRLLLTHPPEVLHPVESEHRRQEQVRG